MANEIMQHVYLTPPGEAVWPSIHKADDKFNPDGTYSTKLRYDPQDPEILSFIEELSAFRDEAFALDISENPGKKNYTPTPIFTDELDKEGNPTGFILINTKMKAVIFSKKKSQEFIMTPNVYDADGTVLNPCPSIGNGSKLQVRGKAVYYAMPTTKMYGLSLRMEDVKILELVEYAGSSKAAW